MFAVVIDPAVCKSDIWWLFPECWGIAVMSSVVLAGFCAVTLRSVRARVTR